MKEYDPFEYDDIRTDCDIFDDCRDCARLGDDCDGREDYEEDED